MALSSAAVLGVYAAGFVRTRAAAQRFADADLRRAPIRAQAPIATPAASPIAMALPTATDSRPAARPAPPVTTTAAPAATPAVTNRTPRPDRRQPVRPAIVSASKPVVSPKPVGSPAMAAATAPAVETTPKPVIEPPPATPAAVTPAPSVATPAAAPAVSTPAPSAAATAYKDGKYSGWGTSRHGDIEATVVIENGRIASASISQCYTRYPCSWIVALPPQVALRQSPEVDYVSGATQSTNAFYYAVIEALSKAK